MIDLRAPPPQPSRVAAAALAVTWFAVFVTLYAVLLLRTGAVEPLAGFAAFGAGLALAFLGALLALAAFAIVWITGASGTGRAVLALLIAAALLAAPAAAAVNGFASPLLNDVSTDLADPPRFERAAADRRPGDLPVPAAAIPADQAALQSAAYPDVAPLRLGVAPEEAANLARTLVEERGWRLLGPVAYPRGGPPTGRVNAVARTWLLGLEDDVAIRIRPDEAGGARVDMRSASRIGSSDLGANAERIRSFLADLAAAAAAAP